MIVPGQDLVGVMRVGRARVGGRGVIRHVKANVLQGGLRMIVAQQFTGLGMTVVIEADASTVLTAKRFALRQGDKEVGGQGGGAQTVIVNHLVVLAARRGQGRRRRQGGW